MPEQTIYALPEGGIVRPVYPISVVGLALWLKADGLCWQDSARTVRATTDGDVVGSWDDASINRAHAIQTTAANKPLYKIGITNEKPVIRFDGSNDLLLSPATAGKPFSLFVVVKFVDASAKYYAGLNANLDNHCLIKGFNAYTEYYVSPRVNMGAAMTSFALHEIVYGNASVDTWQNGVSVVTGGAPSNPGSSGIQPGGATGSYAAADWAEFISYNVAVSIANRVVVENYLRAKYALW